MNDTIELLGAKAALNKELEGVPSIPFNPKWANGTGYLNFAVDGDYAPKLNNGQIVKTIDDHGRLIGIVGTPLGNVVCFERFSDKANNVVVTNMSVTIETMMDFTEGSKSVKDVQSIIGNGPWNDNIGFRLEQLFNQITARNINRI